METLEKHAKKIGNGQIRKFVKMQEIERTLISIWSFRVGGLGTRNPGLWGWGSEARAAGGLPL